MITVIGSINLDLIARVERLPAPGETVPGDNFNTAPGGKGANQALAARRAGAEVRMLGAVGSDAFAAEAMVLLVEAGVDLACVHETHAATGIAMILVGADGQNVIAIVAGANGAVVPGDLSCLELAEGEHVLLQHEIPLSVVRAALDQSRKVGAVSLLNTAPFRAEATELLALADIVIANETEFDLYADALALAGRTREARMADFAARTGRAIVVTLGADGALVATRDRLMHAAAPAIEPVDTVGAGDTFCGYLAAGLEQGLDLAHAAARATVAGTLACLKPGAQPAIPTREEVDAAIAATRAQ